MINNSITRILALGLLLTPVLSTPTDTGGCHHDNVLRALIRFSASAAPFCSAYLSIAPTSTVYVTTPIPTPTTTINPTVLPSYVSQYEPVRVSSACSCMSIPPAITTLTVIPDASCNNVGLAYAIQPNRYENVDTDYTAININSFKTAIASQTGTTRRIGFRNASPAVPYSIYGGTPIQTDYIGINHRGYFVPPVSGVYTITSAYTDDITLVWIGPSALNGAYTRANAVLVNVVHLGPKSTTITLNGGQYYPFRVLVANAQSVAGFELTIRGPNGELIVSQDNAEPTPWFVQYSCDGTSRPFLPFGAEA